MPLRFPFFLFYVMFAFLKHLPIFVCLTGFAVWVEHYQINKVTDIFLAIFFLNLDLSRSFYRQKLFETLSRVKTTAGSLIWQTSYIFITFRTEKSTISENLGLSSFIEQKVNTISLLKFNVFYFCYLCSFTSFYWVFISLFLLRILNKLSHIAWRGLSTENFIFVPVSTENLRCHCLVKLSYHIFRFFFCRQNIKTTKRAFRNYLAAFFLARKAPFKNWHRYTEKGKGQNCQQSHLCQ